MHFTATTHNSRYFEIIDDLDEITGTLNYDIWTDSNATTLTHNYTMDVDIIAVDTETTAVLPILMVYGAKYFKTRASS
ncbi:hypothetical protein [Taibaiella soli]|uniref:Uncharacterized protein n=1 Tax=Taibaiella soli TaxID=1649169 RepID=A0A2W2AG22_9BACT|nr:hypothetical protein [Taibaiella soli]PZF71180.1 hypothetical protein DN068_19590 [Taibaiella soli]